MKAYNDYMNNISVSDALHRRLVSCIAKPEPRRRPVMVRRYAAAFACLAVILVSVFTMPQLLQDNVTPAPGNQSVIDKIMPTPPITGGLTWNKANEQVAASDAAIPGHFWQELNTDELKAVFPGLTGTHSITATVNFSSDENGAAFHHIDAHAVSVVGLRTYIKIAPNEARTDYVISGDVEVSPAFNGVDVTAGYFETKPNSKGLRNVIYFATFKLSDLGYYVELGGAEAEKDALEKELWGVLDTLTKGGAADITVFHPVVPELRNDSLSLAKAREDPDFGAYLPAEVPEGFVFEEATRFIDQESNTLTAHWTKGMAHIHWRVSRLSERDKTLITSVADTKNYDLSLYPIPRAESVPRELREIVNNPIFRMEELTLDTVRTRTYEVEDAGDVSGPRMGFGVLYGDVLVKLNVKGASAEEVFNILQQINTHE